MKHSTLRVVRNSSILFCGGSFAGMFWFSASYLTLVFAAAGAVFLMAACHFAHLCRRSRPGHPRQSKVVYGQCPQCGCKLGISVSSPRQLCTQCGRPLQLVDGAIAEQQLQ